MCFVTNQVDRYLAAMDREIARCEWREMQAHDDSYNRYMQDAVEAVDGLSAADNEVMEDFGVEGCGLLSANGKEAIADKALDLAMQDAFSRYDE